jgi:hypothetical protein
MRLFLSSTYEDLKVHRQKVEDSFAISRLDYNAMEHFGSTANPPLQVCLDAVERSDVLIAILGVRYGSCPPNGKRSFTEREYRHARSHDIPILPFMIDMRDARVAPNLMHDESPEQQRRLTLFKALAEKEHGVTYFTTPEDLARLVLASVIRQFGNIV